MILVDRRTGSKELLKPLTDAGFDASITELEFADCYFQGRGAKGASLPIGVELKTLSDLVGSIRSGRLSGHQLPGLRTSYEYSWLIVEGMWKADDRGMVVTYQGKHRGWAQLPGKITASELEKHVLTFELCGGLHVRYTNSRADTVRFIGTLYRWWSDQDLDGHTSHLAVQTVPSLVPISDFRAAVMRFPGIGLKLSGAVETYFHGNLRKAVDAPAATWANITLMDGDGKSRRLGDAAARKIDRFLSGELA